MVRGKDLGNNSKKRIKKLKPVRKKIPNLLDKVRSHIIWIRDYGSKDAKEKGTYFSSYVTKEELSLHFGVTSGEIQHCLQLLNVEGLVSQAIKQRNMDGFWVPDYYAVHNIQYVKEETFDPQPLFMYNFCPICESELEHRYKFDYYPILCKNGCFSHNVTHEGNIVSIFEVTLYFNEHLSKGHSDRAMNNMNRLIEKWKKDYRYLAEILNRS